MRLAIPTMLCLMLLLLPSAAHAEVVTMSGTVSYFGSYSGSVLYVGALDTAAEGEVNVLQLEAYIPGASPFAQAYSLSFDNAGVSGDVAIASFLDVDGGGEGDISGADVFGWYDGLSEPTFVSPGTSLSGLNFDLPLAEIHGTLTFRADQTQARIDITSDPTCVVEGLRPQPTFNADGSYSIVGLYAGTYCIRGEGSTSTGSIYACYGDPDCDEPQTITLTPTEIRSGVDLDFDATVALERSSWGSLKSRFR